jgi:hypothetical protein
MPINRKGSITVSEWTVRRIVEFQKLGRVVVPDFHGPFSWSFRKVAEYLNSLSDGNSVCPVVLMQIASDDQNMRIPTRSWPTVSPLGRAINGSRRDTQIRQKYLVIDGHHRLSSLGFLSGDMSVSRPRRGNPGLSLFFNVPHRTRFISCHDVRESGRSSRSFHVAPWTLLGDAPHCITLSGESVPQKYRSYAEDQVKEIKQLLERARVAVIEVLITAKRDDVFSLVDGIFPKRKLAL